jgi:16S rRNA processing protein RimM
MDEELLVVGRVARAHGNKGQVIVNPDTDFADDRFQAGRILIVGAEETRRSITGVRFHQGRPIIGLDGIDSMDAAERLAGAELKMRRSDLAALPEGTYYRHDLVGCQVQDTDGRLIGVVASVEGPIDRSRLVIDAPHGEVLIPLVPEICVEVTPAEKKIRVKAPEGLIELNARS